MSVPWSVYAEIEERARRAGVTASRLACHCLQRRLRLDRGDPLLVGAWRASGSSVSLSRWVKAYLEPMLEAVAERIM